jgi:hypothetical protein
MKKILAIASAVLLLSSAATVVYADGSADVVGSIYNNSKVTIAVAPGITDGGLQLDLGTWVNWPNHQIAIIKPGEQYLFKMIPVHMNINGCRGLFQASCYTDATGAFTIQPADVTIPQYVEYKSLSTTALRATGVSDPLLQINYPINQIIYQ